VITISGFFGDFLATWQGKKKRKGLKVQRIFLGEKWARLKLPHYEEKKSKFIILRISVPISHQIREGSRKF
jgi:hypothetical protein